MRLCPSALARPGRRALVACLAVAAGCALTPAAATAKLDVRVLDTKTVRADWHGTAWSVPLDLTGVAKKNARVTATAPCARTNCTVTTTANAKRKWAVSIDVIVKARTPSFSLRLRSGNVELRRTYRLTKPAGRAPGAGSVMVIGDSLAVGTAALLPASLPNRSVTTQARSGRSLGTGMAIFARTPLDRRVQVAVFSLFTNNDPRAVAELTAAVRASMARLGSRRCAVWFTIRRPAVAGVNYRAANAALYALAAEPQYGGRLLVVPWYETIDADHDLLAPDRVHGTTAGYAMRARLTAEAVGRCPVSPV